MNRAQQIKESLEDLRRETLARRGDDGGRPDVAIPMETLKDQNKKHSDFYKQVHHQLSPSGQSYLRENPHVIKHYVGAIDREPEYAHNYMRNAVDRIENNASRS